MSEKKKILVVYTGGTICTRIDGNEKQCDEDTAYALTRNYFESDSKYKDDISFVDGKFFGILSENMTVKNWNVLISYFLEEIIPSLSDYSGIIIAHGTDTLAYTSSLFSLLLKGIKIPIMLVSSNDSLRDKDGNINNSANGNDNFKVAAESICCGLKGGVYVPYKNISDSTMHIYCAQRLEQCKIYSEDFYGAGGIEIKGNIAECISKFNDQLENFNDSDSSYNMLINRFKTNKLKDCVLKIEPYVGLNYKCFSLNGIKAVFHTTYHSGTACVERINTEDEYSDNSILYCIDACCKNDVDFYYSPSFVGEGAVVYDTVPQIVMHNNEFSNVYYAMTNELFYSKLLIAYSLGMDKEERTDFLKIKMSENVTVY